MSDVAGALDQLRIAVGEVEALAAVTVESYDRQDWSGADPVIVERLACLLGVIARSARGAVAAVHRVRVGAWGPLAKALRYEWDSIQKVATGKRAATPALALRVARLAGVPMDELLAGRWLSARVCPHCGHPPEDFADEDTAIG